MDDWMFIMLLNMPSSIFHILFFDMDLDMFLVSSIFVEKYNDRYDVLSCTYI